MEHNKLGKDLYNRIQSIPKGSTRNEAIKALPENEKKAYRRYQNNLRQKRFMSDANNRDRVYVEKREYKKKQRQSNPEKVREIVRGYVQRFRERLKAKKQQAKNVASDILGDIIGNAVNTAEKKKRAAYMRAYRAKNKIT